MLVNLKFFKKKSLKKLEIYTTIKQKARATHQNCLGTPLPLTACTCIEFYRRRLILTKKKKRKKSLRLLGLFRLLGFIRVIRVIGVIIVIRVIRVIGFIKGY
jgi:hypothetical protein